jgi:NAD(P)-dependent dehydrogenase (short-subunit alcohol dehydrogenase family)
VTSKRFELTGRKAVIAGESRFWSKYVAAALSSAGADVAIVGKQSDRLDSAVEEAVKAGGRVLPLTADVRDSLQVGAAIDKTIEEFGGVDILVNAADIPFGKPFLSTTENEWRSVMDGNQGAVINTCRAVGAHMLAQEKGRIINIVSCLAERGLANSTAYCASMGGVLQLTRALALEWAMSGITVNAIGTTWFTEDSEAACDTTDPLVRYIPSKRYGLPDDLPSMVVYLASDSTSFTTGQFMHVDGGLMCHA